MTDGGRLHGLLELIEEVTGNVIQPTDRGGIGELVARRLLELNRESMREYVEDLRNDPASPEWRYLMARITIKESYLFRGSRQIEALSETVIPRVVGDLPPMETLRVWSAGCARGEEAATLAMALAESRWLAGRRWEIVATDVDETALEAARRGLYGRRAVAAVPEALKGRYLTGDGETWQLRPSLLRRIQFQYFNLIKEPFQVPDNVFQIIFLRNVLIYFRESSQRRVIDQMARVLAPEGWMFLGPSESLWPISRALVPVDLGGCFTYRHPVPASQPTPDPGAVAPPPRRPRQKAGKPAEPVVPIVVRPAPLATDGGENPERVVELLHEGRAQEAAIQLERLISSSPDDPELHLLAGLAQDLTGVTNRAIDAYRAALYLKPELFHARYLLAEALRRAGHDGRAAREYRRLARQLTGQAVPTARFAELLGLPDQEALIARCRRYI